VQSLLAIWVKLIVFTRMNSKRSASSMNLIPVSLVMIAYNEADHIRDVLVEPSISTFFVSGC
jgi:hypothetical protein